MRIFLALNFEPSLRSRVHGDLAALRDTAPDIRWMRPEQLHVTMRFFGEVPDGEVDSIVEATRPVVARHRRLALELSGIGAFPHWRRPRIIWLGVRDPSPVLPLAAELEAASRSLGLTPEERPFRAHVTIGRVTRPLATGRAPVLERAAREFTGTYPATIHTVDLMRSQLAAGGSLYSVIASFPLEGE